MRCGRWLVLLALPLSSLAWAEHARPVAIDTEHSVIGFEIRTRYGQRLKGRFPVFSGQVQTLADGRQQVSLDIDARHAQIEGYRRYTGWLRSEQFFDVRHHPMIAFRSAPHAPGLAHTGGEVEGELTLRGVSGGIRMVVDSSECETPGYDCPVAGRGTVSRAAYGMDGWQVVVGDRVTFVLQIRLHRADPS